MSNSDTRLRSNMLLSEFSLGGDEPPRHLHARGNAALLFLTTSLFFTLVIYLLV